MPFHPPAKPSAGGVAKICGGQWLRWLGVDKEKSGWITLNTRCENGAIAHTTPVYLIMDGQPTWSPTKGPALIQKQLAAIVKIEQEFAGKQTPRAAGVRERLGRARAYYSKLQAEMQKAVRNK